MIEFNDLTAFLDYGWSVINRGVADAKSLGRYPTLATVSETTLPEIRTVVLRKANRHKSTLDIYTDTLTQKVNSLKKNPNGNLHIWLPKKRLQIRMSVVIDIQTGSIVKTRWGQLPQKSRVSYGTMPPSGDSINEPLAYKRIPAFDRFAVLKCKVKEIELLHLGGNHTRAEYKANSGWGGTWLVP